MRTLLSSRLFSFLACLIAGSVSAYAMAPTNLWFLMLGGIATLYVFTSNARSLFQAFLYGWGWGFGYFVLSLSWIGNALLVDGNEYVWAYPLAVIGLPIVLALYQGVAMMLFPLSGKTKTTSGLFVFTILLGGAEILRGILFTGFPWNLYGYAWTGVPEILQSVSLINTYGLTILTVLWGATAGFLISCIIRRQFTVYLAALCLISLGSAALLWSFGQWRLDNTYVQSSSDISIKIVQPNIPQAEKWDTNLMQSHYQTLNDLSRANGTENQTTYIVWPETSINPRLMGDIRNKELLKQTLASYRGNAYLFTGALRFEPTNNQYYNSLLLFNKEAENIQAYDKSHLVPFGEYIPFKEFIPLETVTKFAGFARGNGPIHQDTPEGISYSALVCYEIIFPGKVTDKNAPSPDFIINVTNDAWYGDSAGPYQHLTKAIFRAVEEGVPVIRAANTGISAIIDPLGQVRNNVPLGKKGELTLPLIAKRKTTFSDFIKYLRP
jgi:apolipoprotein N-acyltransferase